MAPPRKRRQSREAGREIPLEHADLGEIDTARQGLQGRRQHGRRFQRQIADRGADRTSTIHGADDGAHLLAEQPSHGRGVEDQPPVEASGALAGKGQRAGLVRPQVEGADADGAAAHGEDQLAINVLLFIFGRDGPAGQEQELAAIQADGPRAFIPCLGGLEKQVDGGLDRGPRVRLARRGNRPAARRVFGKNSLRIRR